MSELCGPCYQKSHKSCMGQWVMQSTNGFGAIQWQRFFRCDCGCITQELLQRVGMAYRAGPDEVANE